MSKRLMPTYLVNFLKEIYDGTIPSNFGKRMVSRQFIARVKELYETLGVDNPSDYSRRMVNEYLIKFFNEIEIVEYTDDDVLMTKTIPSDLVYPACRIDSIGGMSYKCNNLFDIENATYTSSDNWNITTDFYLEAGKTYTIKSNATAHNLFTTGVAGWRNITNTSQTFTPSQSGYLMLGDTAYNWYTCLSEFKELHIMLNYGSTALPYQPYFTGIRDSAVTAVKTYNIGDELIDTYTVPSAITSLEGYGQSNPDDPTVYNEVNFIDGKYYEKGYIDNGEWVTKVAEVTISENAPLLEVVPDGTIVFENTYSQDMPSEVTTWIKES